MQDFNSGNREILNLHKTTFGAPEKFLPILFSNPMTG